MPASLKPKIDASLDLSLHLRVDDVKFWYVCYLDRSSQWRRKGMKGRTRPAVGGSERESDLMRWRNGWTAINVSTQGAARRQEN